MSIAHPQQDQLWEVQESCENGPWSTVQLFFRQCTSFQQLAGKMLKDSLCNSFKALQISIKWNYSIKFSSNTLFFHSFALHFIQAFHYRKGEKKSITSNTWTNNTARPICSCRKLPTQELVMLMRRLIWYFWQSESTKAGPSSRSHSFCWLVN